MDLIGLQSVILSGLVLGSLYALMSTGLSLVWGTVRMFNFAHGSLIMLGAYLAWTFGGSRGLNLGKWGGLALACAAMFLVGMIIERFLARPFVKRPNAVMMVLITTLAASSFLDNSAQLIWGPRMKRLPPLLKGDVNILGSAISAHELMIMILAPILLLALVLFLRHTRLGLAIRAVEQNLDFAQLVGIRVPNTYAVTFGLGAVLAALAGILWGSKSFIIPTMGAEPQLKAFIVVILGGIGSLGGTIAGAYIVGFLEALSVFLLGLYWTPAVLFLIMILVLVFRPSGLFGRD